MIRGPMGWAAESREVSGLASPSGRSSPAAGPAGRGQGAPWWGKQERPVMVKWVVCGGSEELWYHHPVRLSAEKSSARDKVIDKK